MIRLLSNKKISILVVLVAIIARAIQLLFYLDSFFDTSFQVIATQNFVAGHGISTAIAYPADLSSTVYEPLVNWPPGYSILLSAPYIVSGHQYLVACFIVDLLAATAIILLCRRMLQLLDVQLWVINLFTLFTSFFIYYFYYTGSTDSISIAFFLGAITLILGALKTNKSWVARTAGSAICLLTSASLKYLFFPVVFILPVFLFIYGYQNRSAVIKNAALVAFGIVATGIAGLYLYQQAISGSGAHISSPGRGFFPEHLLRAHPFLPASFVTPNTLRKLPGNETPWLNFFRVIHVLAYAVILFVAARSFFRNGLLQASLTRTFLFLVVSISLAITLVLFGLSLFVDKELMPPDRWWTYVEDARYYGLAEIMVHLVIFLFFGQYAKQTDGKHRYLFLLLPFLLLPEIARGLAFTVKRVANYGKEKYYWQQEKDFQDFASAIIANKTDSLRTAQTVVSGSLYYGNHRTALHHQIPVLEAASLNEPDLLRTTEPVLLLALIRHDHRGGYRPFIDYPGTELAGQYNGFYFYTLYVAPR